MPPDPRVAVLLRTYQWDDFVVRSARRLHAQAPGTDFFILIDETASGPVETAPFRKIAHVAGDFPKLGLPIVSPRGPALWWSCDYGFYDAYLKQPDYDYYFFVEDDVAVNLPLLPLAQQMAAAELDCVTYGGHRSIGQQWVLHVWCRQIPYRSKTWTPLSVTLISRRALAHLFGERRFLGALLRAGLIENWSFCEAFVSSALLAAGLRTEQLSKFANVDDFGSNLTFLESDPGIRKPGTFVHAVLDEARFGPKFFTRGIAGLLANGDYARLATVRRQLLQTGFASYGSFRVRCDSRNLALDKPASQSSVSGWSRPVGRLRLDPFSIDARGANCGIVSEAHAFHTNGELNAWWGVDLRAVRQIAEVRLFNSTLVPERARNFTIQTSRDGERWECVFHKDDDRVFAGPDDPFSCRFAKRVRARQVRVVLDSHGPLHLAGVEVYGPGKEPPP